MVVTAGTYQEITPIELLVESGRVKVIAQQQGEEVMADIIPIKTAREFPQDAEGNILLECGQKWIDRNTGKTWIISEIYQECTDDEVCLTIYLIDLQGKPCDSAYTEEYFREWFDEAGEYWSWRLETIYGGNRPRKKELTVIQGGKKA